MTNNSDLSTEQKCIVGAAACLGVVVLGPLGALVCGGVALADQVINHSDTEDPENN